MNPPKVCIGMPFLMPPTVLEIAKVVPTWLSIMELVFETTSSVQKPSKVHKSTSGTAIVLKLFSYQSNREKNQMSIRCVRAIYSYGEEG